MEKMSSSNIIEEVSKLASILGMMVIGGMVSTYVVVNSPIKIGVGKSAVSLVSTLNQIMPSMLPVLATLAVYWMLKKKWKIGWILVSIIVFSILGTWIGFLSA